MRALREAAGATQAGWAARLGRDGERSSAGKRASSAQPGRRGGAAAAVRRTRPVPHLLPGSAARRDGQPPSCSRLLAEARLNGMRADVEAARHAERRRSRDTRAGVHLPCRARASSDVSATLSRCDGCWRSRRPGDAERPGRGGQDAAGHPPGARAAARHADGVWLVDLSAIVDPALVPGRRRHGARAARATWRDAARDARSARCATRGRCWCSTTASTCCAASAQLADRLLASCPSAARAGDQPPATRRRWRDGVAVGGLDVAAA